MRGLGIPQPRFAIERQIDLIAEQIGVDAVEMRIKNAIHAHDEHPAGFITNTCGFAESIETAADAIGWKEKRGKLPFGRRHPRLGRDGARRERRAGGRQRHPRAAVRFRGRRVGGDPRRA